MRYERDRPGELVHVDVKKLGRIPDGGGWKAHGRGKGNRANRTEEDRLRLRALLVDDHTRLAYSEVLPDEKGATCAGFLLRAAADFASRGITRIEEVITDNHRAYKLSHDFRDAMRRRSTPTTCSSSPLPLAKRQGRTLQPHPGHRVGLPRTIHQQRRPHAPLRPGSSTTTLTDATAHSEDTRPISRRTNLMAEYS